VKIYDIPVSRHRKYADILESEVKEYDLIVHGKRQFDVTVTNLPNKFLLFLRNDLAFGAGKLHVTSALYNEFYIDHRSALDGAIQTEAEKELAIYYEFDFNYGADIRTEYEISVSESGLVLNSDIDLLAVNYRELNEMDSLLLTELDNFTLEELDYITEGTSDER
jgi:hypothetical protein